jgi:choline kinase
MSEAAKHAIILAAGRGSRMGNLTAERPKCLTVLAGKTLLEWQVSALTAGGIESITVVRGYRKELLSGPGYSVLENPEWSTTNMVSTLLCASSLLRVVPCLVSYSDIVYRADHVQALARAGGDVAISYDVMWEGLWSSRFEHPLSDAETFRQENGWLVTIGERAERISDVQGQYMGLLKFTPEGWARTESFLSGLAADRRQKIDMTSLLRELLKAGVAIRCVPVSGGWCEVDQQSDVNTYARLLEASALANEKWTHDWRR